MKKCKICKIDKEYSEFYKYQGRCKSCSNIITSEWRRQKIYKKNDIPIIYKKLLENKPSDKSIRQYYMELNNPSVNLAGFYKWNKILEK